MNLERLKEAVECYKDYRADEPYKTLIDLATSVLNADMPKEKDITDTAACVFSTSEDILLKRALLAKEKEGYNQALHDCTLYTTRILLEKEEQLKNMKELIDIQNKTCAALEQNEQGAIRKVKELKAENEKARRVLAELGYTLYGVGCEPIWWEKCTCGTSAVCPLHPKEGFRT